MLLYEVSTLSPPTTVALPSECRQEDGNEGAHHGGGVRESFAASDAMAISRQQQRNKRWLTRPTASAACVALAEADAAACAAEAAASRAPSLTDNSVRIKPLLVGRHRFRR